MSRVAFEKEYPCPSWIEWDEKIFSYKVNFERHSDPNLRQFYNNYISAWYSWQKACRNIVVQLPPVNSYYGASSEEEFGYDVESIQNALTEAGISYLT